MNKKTTIPVNDLKALRFVGLMGHPIAGISDSDKWSWGRSCYCEVNSVESAVRFASGEKNVRIYQQGPRGWKDVTPKGGVR